MIFRDGTNLKASYNTQPVLRICAERESHEFKDIQVGPPLLPMAGRKYDFSLLREWLDECGRGHSRFGCREPPGEHGTRFLPTRVLDLEYWQNGGLIRLHCTQESNCYEYVALSHCWGAPSEDEWEAVCTHGGNFEMRCHKIVFADLPRTFQDAVIATRKLGKRYLWIDSLCIIQRDEEDWEKESALMESVFSSAYCTISATSARTFNDGFLLARPDQDCIPVPNAPQAAGPLWLSETVDNFHADVEEGPVNRRGWVLQERVLSRRTIYFTKNQIYFECGGGVRCETMTWLWNPRAALLGDAQFPDAILKRDPADRIAPLQTLFEAYTAMNLTVATDRSVAISGLERRLASGFEGIAAYGALECYIHRSLLWQRTGETPLRRIKYPGKRSIPSWSWMAYDGAIQYLDVPKEGIEWNHFVSFAPARNLIASTPENNRVSINELKVGVSALCVTEIQKDHSGMTLDNPGATDFGELACVVIGRSITSGGSRGGDVELYVLFVRSVFMDGYQRVGAGRIQESHLATKGPIAGRIV
ncbi:heterokaryon incompatibility protein-domain-containing protein [Lasiosphaeria hispida]|uniref:Heterokaryon incompatibility protein-domain-containing protein n=1 Tax=Lasiosphaeria hispida TaxID=260671 RepID=A0AAJ0HSU2_9PEZI|nr:heterokaryon incompatibility protein-domain-containing protein [Lasiosphaeria hispida]